MKRRDLLKHLEALGCVFVREGHGHKFTRIPQTEDVFRFPAIVRFPTFLPVRFADNLDCQNRDVRPIRQS
jgi:hypothetical protein